MLYKKGYCENPPAACLTADEDDITYIFPFHSKILTKNFTEISLRFSLGTPKRNNVFIK